MNTRRDDAFLPYPPPLANHPGGDGALRGLRLAVKDIFDVAGYPTGAGNAFVLAASGVKTRNATLVDTLVKAGAELVGKTYTDELAYSLTGLNIHFGTPRSPLSPTQLPGGSSSGSAVAVATGLADIGLGSDTSGSIRVPAAVNGCLGWRPTHGILSLEGCRPLAPSLDAAGLIVANSEVLLRVMDACGIPASPPWADRQLVVPRDLLDCCDSSIVDPFLEGLRAKTIDYVIVAQMAGFSLTELAEAFTYILWHEAWISNRELLERRPDSIERPIHDRLVSGAGITVAQLREAHQLRERLERELAARFEPSKLVAFPTLPVVIPALDATSDALREFRQRVLLVNCAAGLTGRPQLTMPLEPGGHPTLPVSILGARGTDRRLAVASIFIQRQTDVLLRRARRDV